MSRAELAEEVNAELWRKTGRRYALDAHAIARYERGAVRWPNTAYRSALRTVLGVADTDLGFRPTRRGATASSCGDHHPGSSPPHGAVEPELVALHRRDFVRRGLAALATSVAGADRRDGSGQRTPLDYETELTELQAMDLSRGAGGPILGVAQLLRGIASDLRTARGADRADLLRVGARAAEFAGFLYRDLGDPARCLYLHDRAMEWAQENQDEPMQAYVLLRKAQAAYDQRDAERMLGLARAAHRFHGALPPGLQAEVLQQEARGEAMLGLPHQGVQRKLYEARALLHRANSDHPNDAPGSSYDERLLDLQTAVCLTESGRPRDAVGGYQKLFAGATFCTRDRAYFSTLMATALALSGEPEEAAATVCKVLPAAIKTNSRRTVREAHIVASALRPWSKRPAVRDLDEALAATRIRATAP